jgi:hypothetical protein
MDETVRQDMKRFVDRWRAAGAALEDQRRDELSCLSDEQALRMTQELLALWRPSEHDDCGAELLAQQRVFRRLRERGQVPR